MTFLLFEEFITEKYSEEEKEALTDYKFNSKYIDINKFLRGKISKTDEIDNLILKIDSAISKGKTIKDIFYKGINSRIGFKNTYKVGDKM